MSVLGEAVLSSSVLAIVVFEFGNVYKGPSRYLK
jgi:hypothetical protein